MDEKETIIQKQSSNPVKTSKWANIAIWLLLIGYVTLIFFIILLIIFDTSKLISFVLPICVLLILVSFISIIVSLVSGIIAAISIGLSKWRMEGIGRSVISIIFSLIFIFSAYELITALLQYRHENICKYCAHNLNCIRDYLERYADENEKYPQPEKWCDILMKDVSMPDYWFQCSLYEKVKYSYSMNPNCDPNSEPNTVLLFESKAGWNSYGGPELLVANRHKDGSHILFNDGHVAFIKIDSNRMPIEQLNWGEKTKGRGLK